MRISDWSSDVCSSDLLDARRSLGKYLALCVAHVERVALHEPFEFRARVVGVGKDMRRLARLDLREEALERDRDVRLEPRHAPHPCSLKIAVSQPSVRLHRYPAPKFTT